jgi:hypothetical protein
MATILAGMQDSLLVLRSTKAGWNIHQSLVGTHPQSLAFDPLNPGRASGEVYGRQMMADKIGIKLENKACRTKM